MTKLQIRLSNKYYDNKVNINCPTNYDLERTLSNINRGTRLTPSEKENKYHEAIVLHNQKIEDYKNIIVKTKSEFREDLKEHFKTGNYSKEDKIFDKAWKDGYYSGVPNGYTRVASVYGELVELVELVELPNPET